MDWLYGGDGADVISLNLATLDGFEDQAYGGAGDDMYVLTDATDFTAAFPLSLYEDAGGGIDTIKFEFGSKTLSENIENAIALDLDGKGSGMTGNSLDNLLTGGAGDDYFDGQLGNDTMIGGGGQDYFNFSTAPGSGNIDHIRDFDPAMDKINLAASLNDNLSTAPSATHAELGPIYFKDLSVGPLDADDRIIYDPSTGTLSYDPDGNGVLAAVTIAVLDNHAVFTAANLFVYD